MTHLDELDRAEGLRRQLDGLVEPGLPSVRHVNHLDDVLQQSGVEQVAPLSHGRRRAGTGGMVG